MLKMTVTRKEAQTHLLLRNLSVGILVLKDRESCPRFTLPAISNFLVASMLEDAYGFVGSDRVMKVKLGRG